ncbi:hypothetical protein BBOV_I004250 [Babesia bovis T2Bo]|uniref:t-SNARE coiled-coil homology domain-containing protein n=1 Tax=Babesia bovis TaxID=5865 RepID=A7AWS8_BABBO|nr:hypothetical protein BBOV_I004250 [Babesia bovis T2Bo]EDO05506.1 hypothetical protein BBOV_I004250 [Babesia bovis T2Bo]|eukprot:XP_001609074.1 hypothetical protein [Babesia bovis T2Bo]
MELQSQTPNEDDDVQEHGITQVVMQYSKSITQSLKKALSHSVEAGNVATDSLTELQSQNENINRIKDRLNESHESVTTTQKIVDAYLNSVSWITNSVPWKKGIQLKKDMEPNVSTGKTKFWDTTTWFPNKETLTKDIANHNSITHAVSHLAVNTSDHLDILIEELRNNRQKTETIANAVQKQNDDLDRISESAVGLQERVNQINQVLKDRV